MKLGGSLSVFDTAGMPGRWADGPMGKRFGEAMSRLQDASADAMRHVLMSSIRHRMASRHRANNVFKSFQNDRG